ncbi:hypothetical protein X943_000077 [Babesia divergens]|uniref:Uncharacterized protein n=1 Tax=Babesia divergens TaxID=32595 RepID=A0AAD9GES4_BABDI|nr:hypothetical protein X943_000077 [Babesia divergens]
MLRNRWNISTDDALLSLIHIKSHMLQEYMARDPANVEDHSNALGNSINDEDTLLKITCQDPICVSQGATLAIGVLIRPIGELTSVESWYTKYKDRDITAHIPRYDDDGKISLLPRIDTLSNDTQSCKRTVVGKGAQPYILYVTFGTVVVHDNMLNKSLPLTVYIIPKGDSCSKVVALSIVGEVMVKEILQIQVAVRDNLVLATLTNTDVKDNLVIEDAQITCAYHTRPDISLPFTLGSNNKMNLMFRTGLGAKDMLREDVKVLIKW